VISVSTLLCDHAADGNRLRYDVDTGTDDPVSDSPQRRPVVVWNTTNRCNLECVHCYAGAESEPKAGELTTAEGKRLLDDLADYGAPVVLFSGGEPMVRAGRLRRRRGHPTRALDERDTFDRRSSP